MPKTKLAKFKDTKKQKLSPAERSQVAKDRWAKRRADKAMEEVVVTVNTILEQDAAKDTPAPPQPPEQPPVTPESIAPGLVGEPISVEPFRPAPSISSVPYNGLTDAINHGPQPMVDIVTSTPQPAPVAPKKVKRYTGPKEFSVALKAAESRLAKAIVERAQAAGQLAALQAEIPSLLQIIAALKGPQNTPIAPYGWEGPTYSTPSPAPQFQPYVDPMAAIAGAAAAPPVSRASGGAMQFGPEVFGELEGPEDDTDKFISGPAAGNKGWI